MAVVHILKKYSGESIARIPVNLGGLNYEPSVDEIINEAWRCIIEDGTVPPDSERVDYLFQVLG